MQNPLAMDSSKAHSAHVRSSVCWAEHAREDCLSRLWDRWRWQHQAKRRAACRRQQWETINNRKAQQDNQTHARERLWWNVQALILNVSEWRAVMAKQADSHSVVGVPSIGQSERVERAGSERSTSQASPCCATASRGPAALSSDGGDIRYGSVGSVWAAEVRGAAHYASAADEDRPRLHFRLADWDWPSYSLSHSPLCCTPPSQGAAERDRRHA